MSFYNLHCTLMYQYNFFQFYLAMLGDQASSRVKSAAKPFIRPVSSGSQIFDSHPDLYPLTQPITKLSAKLQVTQHSYIVTVWSRNLSSWPDKDTD